MLCSLGGNHCLIGDSSLRLGTYLRRSNRFSSVNDSWSTQCPIDAIAPLKECMSRDAFINMYWCIHFSDDFDNNKEWSDIFFDKKRVLLNTARHLRKLGEIKDAINHQWKEGVTSGMAMTHNKSRIAGWYKSEITCGPESKPIWTGATLHSMAVSFGPLARYKLHARTFGGKNDGNLRMVHEKCASIQKWINLMLLMLKDYKGQGRYVTMDLAYMGDIMVQAGREVLGMNMVRTVQCN